MTEAPNTNRKKVRRSFLGTRIFYNCPKCGKPLEFRKKMHRNLCMRCGQYLDWDEYDKMACVWIEASDAEEARYWAGQFVYFSGCDYGLDPDEWRLIRKEYPILLYFPFPEGKAYGRFMRKAAKEAKIIKEFD